MRQKYFGKNIAPACSYCLYGSPAPDERTVLCSKNGVVSPFFSCRKYRYDPLKRRPAPQNVLPRYDRSDFEL